VVWGFWFADSWCCLFDGACNLGFLCGGFWYVCVLVGMVVLGVCGFLGVLTWFRVSVFCGVVSFLFVVVLWLRFLTLVLV